MVEKIVPLLACYQAFVVKYAHNYEVLVVEYACHFLSMEGAVSLFSDVSLLRRVLLASKQIPKETPSYWNIVTNFAFKSKAAADRPRSDKVRLFVENTQALDSEALKLDEELLKELIHHKGFHDHPLGIVLISSNTTCKVCGGDLLIRADRPSFITGYTNSLGTIPFTHFRKYCNQSKRGCPFTQHYGFHAHGEDVEFDDDWKDLPYFMSTNKTVFEMKLLKEFNAELLIGQISYNQRCDIYNYNHGYETKQKMKSTRKKFTEDEEPHHSADQDEETHGLQQASRCVKGVWRADSHTRGLWMLSVFVYPCMCRFEDRLKLDRRRFEEGHIKFCVLDVYKHYPKAFPKWVIRSSLQETLNDISPMYYNAFSEKYAGN